MRQRRVRRDEDPIRPSLRRSTSEARAKIAQTRQSDPSRLSALMGGELDWIVMKALEKDRTRRYETATSLGQDVTRYLDGDAVEACPPTLRYRFGKFARRNRPQVAAAALVLGALVLAIAVTTFRLIRAHEQREATRGRSNKRSSRGFNMHGTELPSTGINKSITQRQNRESNDSPQDLLPGSVNGAVLLDGCVR